MPSAARSIQIATLVQDFIEDEGGEPSRPSIGCFGKLEPDEVLDACRGAMLAWAIGNLPGTRLFLVGGSLVATR